MHFIFLFVIFMIFYYIYQFHQLKSKTSVGGKINLTGARVLITGGSEGIGKAIAKECAKRGSHVTIAARRQKVLEEAVKDILEFRKSESQIIQYMELDITENYEIIDSKIQKLLEDGSIDVLINCAGFSDLRTLNELPWNQIYNMIDCNLLGSIKVTKSVCRNMIDKRYGQIVFVSSVCAQFGFTGTTAYSASKFGIRGFADALAMELKPFNVGITVIFPPDTETPGFEKENITKNYVARKISEDGGLHSPEDVAKKAVESITNRDFWCTYGFNGYFIGILTQGTSPIIDLPSMIVSTIYLVIKLAFYKSLSSFYNLTEKFTEQNYHKQK